MSRRVAIILALCAAVVAAALPGLAQEADKQVSFQAQETPIGELLPKLAKESGATILAESTLTNKVTLTVTEVSLQEALEKVCKATGLALWRVGLTPDELTKQKISADDLARAARALSLVESKVKGLVLADAKQTSVVQLKQTAKRDVTDWQPEKLFPSLANTYLVCAKQPSAGLEANLPDNFDVNAFLALPPDQRGAALAPYPSVQRQAIIGTAIKQAIMGFGQLPPEERGPAIRSGFRDMMLNASPEDRAGLLQITFGVMSQLDPAAFADVMRNFMPFVGPPPPP